MEIRLFKLLGGFHSMGAIYPKSKKTELTLPPSTNPFGGATCRVPTHFGTPLRSAIRATIRDVAADALRYLGEGR